MNEVNMIGINIVKVDMDRNRPKIQLNAYQMSKVTTLNMV